jgi:hypothetical protein
LTNDHPNALLLERIYKTVAEGTTELFEASAAEPFVVHGAGDGPVGGRLVGLDEMKTHIAQLTHLSDGSFRHEPLAFFADDLWAVVPQVMTATRKGRTLEMHVAGFWRFNGQGQLAEHWEAVADPPAWDAFWSG